MTDLWSFLLQTLTASGAAALLLAMKAMFRDKLSPRWQFAVWGILGLVLLFPAGSGGRYVLVNWPFFIETVKSALTGEYGTLARVLVPVPLPPAAPPQSGADWLYLVYLAGVVLCLTRYILSYARLRRALRRGRPADSSLVQTAAARWGLETCPAVEAEGLPSAFICGVFRPVLALPSGVETDEKVILHELLHLKHRDAVWGLVICFFRCVHWCNPLLWLCANLAGNDLESLCDQRVLERLEGEDRRDYGRILLSMADERYARAPGTSSMANGGRNIRRRIQAIARFKRYPQGMALVSVCVALVAAGPLLLGARAQAVCQGPFPIVVGEADAVMASARTVYCTTYAGAFDAYAKAVLRGYLPYRAMCAPLEEQNALAAAYQAGDWADLGLPSPANLQAGYYIHNLAPTGEEAWEGILTVELAYPPEGVAAEDHYVWLGVQRLRAEKEGDRWVIRPLEEFRAVQAIGWTSMPGLNCDQLPAWIYEAETEDFALQVRRQTTAWVESQVQTGDWFLPTLSFDTAPQPRGIFTIRHGESLFIRYTGSPERKSQYTHVAAVSFPLWPGEKRRILRNPGMGDASGTSSTGESWGSCHLEGDWQEDPVFICGGGTSGDGELGLPERYAVDLYLNGRRAAELTLLPSEGGESFG